MAAASLCRGARPVPVPVWYPVNTPPSTRRVPTEYPPSTPSVLCSTHRVPTEYPVSTHRVPRQCSVSTQRVPTDCPVCVRHPSRPLRWVKQGRWALRYYHTLGREYPVSTHRVPREYPPTGRWALHYYHTLAIGPLDLIKPEG